jgi:transposase
MIHLSKSQRIILEKAHIAEKNKKQADRIKTILALDKGFSHKDISRMLCLNDSTTRGYEQEYENNGLDKLLNDNYKGGTGKLTKSQEKKLESHISQTIYGSAKEISKYINSTFDVTYSPQGLVSLLHRLGFSYKKTKHIPGKADPEKQQAFLKIYRRLRKKAKNSNIFLYFLDGSHPQHNSMPAYAWIKKGQDKELKSNTGRQRVNLNGALNIADHTIVIREEDTINAQATIKLLKNIENKHPDADKIYCIADNARYYKAKMVREYEKLSKIELVFLPAYAPNLNLIERLWKFFHKKMMYNQYYSSYAEFQKAINKFFKNMNKGKYTDELSTLLVENFQIIGKQIS